MDNPTCENCQRATHRHTSLKNELIKRINRAEGQVRGIKNMIEKDAYCDDILHQIAAVQAALSALGKRVLHHHMKSCLVEKIRNGEDDIVDELIVTIGKLL